MALGAKYGMMKKEDMDIKQDNAEEVSMMRTQLRAMIVKAQDLLDHMPSNMNIEPWVQSKIAVAKEMVSGVHDYMLYSDDQDDQPSMNIPPMSGMSNPYSMSTEETEQVSEALGTIANQKAATKFNQSNISKMDREEKQRQHSLSPKQKKIAAVAGDKDKIDADDFKALRSSKKIEEKMSPAELDKFADIAPPKGKITQADKIMAAKMAAKKK
jgi:hypothetical protein